MPLEVQLEHHGVKLTLAGQCIDLCLRSLRQAVLDAFVQGPRTLCRLLQLFGHELTSCFENLLHATSDVDLLTTGT
jgi:hypothetical protein